MTGVSIQNLTRHNSPMLAGSVFSKIAKELLSDWEISLTFVGPAKARALNKMLRKKKYVPNVLSYVVGEKSAEIILCPSEAKKRAPDYGMSENTFIVYLFIHGALHIKGWSHGDKMEACERKLLTKYGATDSNRHRHRHVPSKDGRGRRALR